MVSAEDSPEVNEPSFAEILRALEREYDRRVEEMIRRYQSAPETWNPSLEKNLPH